MKQYHELLFYILENGIESEDRTGTGTLSVFGYQARYDLSAGFPLLTTKRVHWKSVVVELLWFLRGDTNVKWLNDNGCTIWNEWRSPWLENRPIVLVDKKTFEPVNYCGNFSYKGVEAAAGSVNSKLASAWAHMMKRCYDETAHNFKYYGARGISVCERWHDCKTFIEDVKKLPHWHYKLENWNDYQLDKDYYDSNQYNPESCIWLPNFENVCERQVGIEFPDGSQKWYLSLPEAAKQSGLSKTSIHRFLTEGMPKILKGKNKIADGWKFMTEHPDKKLVRRALISEGELGPVYGKQWRLWNGKRSFHDQIETAIEQIKTNPNDRGIIVSAWNVAELEEMALRPCHCLFQFYVRNGKLSCQLYQRSADAFLGVPFNIASYALLTHMIAQVCDLDVGEFVHTFGDLHIYKNHLDQVKLQLSREPRPLPLLVLNGEIKNIDDFTLDDIVISGYDPHPAIKGEVAV